MKLLILTQKVDSNDAILGFMYSWIIELAKHCEKVTVVCLEKGVFSLPLNVKVLSLGKETGQAKIKYLINFYKYIWQERKNYDTVFVHMNPEYVVLAGWLWKMLGKRIALWYTHKQIDLKLRLAEKLADIIFTASTKSFRLMSKKINVMGHGIDIERFIPASEPAKEKIILTVDRISPTKNQLEIVKLFAAIKKKVDDCRLYIVGAPAYLVDEDYFNQIKEYIKDHGLSGQVKLLGAVPNKDMPAVYQQAKVFISFSATGSLDKAVLEAMACNLPVVTTNEACKDIFPAENYAANFADAEQKVIKFLEHGTAVNYRDTVVKNHSLKNLIAKIIKKLS